jgi:hypothetical protein
MPRFKDRDAVHLARATTVATLTGRIGVARGRGRFVASERLEFAGGV